MPGIRRSRRVTIRVARIALGAMGLLVLGVCVVVGFGGWILLASRPVLEGERHLSGLSASVQVGRDGQGTPTIVAANRIDLARALGFLHGQERFFEMDLLRRAGAGELSGLVGAAALKIDRVRRLHRFRARAEAALASQTADQRSLVAAYTAGVNAGLAALSHAPWEYTLLRVLPARWTEADTSLVVYAMYFDLQASDATEQQTAALMRAVLGQAMADFLNPKGTHYDAAVDGSVFPDPPVPQSMPASGAHKNVQPAPPAPGSNNFAVSGRLTATGSAMVANDMHLGLTAPNIWYRARMQAPGLDLIGVTLPGVPFLVVGSNGHVAWGFTDGYIESGDAVTVDLLAGDPREYRTPGGPRPIRTVVEEICPARAPCENFPVDETIWGPVVSHDSSGAPIVWRWSAHDQNAVMTAGFTGLETATSVREALDAAHRAGLPQQNFLVGDSAGHIAWTIIGQVPRRVGLDDQVTHSWADGTHRWDGYLSPGEVPEIVDPPSGRLWTANNRVVGGDALAKLGDGGYADGMRAGRLRDDLAAGSRFAESDLLAIQTDDRAAVLDHWQHLFLQAIDVHAGDARIIAMRQAVVDWGGRAVPGSVGYRLVEGFRRSALRLVEGGLFRPVAAQMGETLIIPSRTEWPVERLLTERPASLVPPPYKDWNAVTGAVLDMLATDVDSAGGLKGFTWGAVNRVGIRHPLSRFVPLLGMLTDAPDVAVAGDTVVPRVAVPGFGASERLVVSPGHEASGLFEMPMGEAGNPLAPYYGAGQEDWVAGKAAPLLPGAARWHLTLSP